MMTVVQLLILESEMEFVLNSIVETGSCGPFPTLVVAVIDGKYLKVSNKSPPMIVGWVYRPGWVACQA